MPWRREAMKDVASCDKPRGAANRHRSGDFRMGQPLWSHIQRSPAEFIGREKQTRGSEPSQYPEEKKANANQPKPKGLRFFRGCGAEHGASQGVIKNPPSRRSLESAAKEGDSPVGERRGSFLFRSRVPRGTRNPVGIRVDHHPRLNITLRPIVNQYREGKVKRTPVRGVKEYLNPSIYKQWNHHVARRWNRVPFA